jgi:hypothetical protein
MMINDNQLYWCFVEIHMNGSFASFCVAKALISWWGVKCTIPEVYLNENVKIVYDIWKGTCTCALIIM